MIFSDHPDVAIVAERLSMGVGEMKQKLNEKRSAPSAQRHRVKGSALGCCLWQPWQPRVRRARCQCQSPGVGHDAQAPVAAVTDTGTAPKCRCRCPRERCAPPTPQLSHRVLSSVRASVLGGRRRLRCDQRAPAQECRCRCERSCAQLKLKLARGAQVTLPVFLCAGRLDGARSPNNDHFVPRPHPCTARQGAQWRSVHVCFFFWVGGFFFATRLIRL